MNDETIAFVVRETGWTLDYIRCLPVSEFYALVAELSYQRAVDDYRQECRFATLMATMGNLWSKRKVELSELVGQPPERSKMTDDKILAKGTKMQTIALADGKEYELAPMTLNIMIQVEDKFTMSYFDLINGRRMNHIRYIVYLRLKGKYSELTEEKVGDLITTDVLTEISTLYGME